MRTRWNGGKRLVGQRLALRPLPYNVGTVVRDVETTGPVRLGVLLVKLGFIPASPDVSREAGFGEFQPLGYPVVGLSGDSHATHIHCD